MHSKTIKIAHIIGSLQYGGAENQVVAILNGLNSLKFKKFLLVLAEGKREQSQTPSPEVMNVCLKFRRWGHIGCILKLYRFCKLHRIDVVQAHLFHINLHAAIAATLAGVPVVITTEHGRNPWKTSIHRIIEKRLISPLVTMRVAVSQDIRDLRVRHEEVSADKITVIRNCVQIPERPIRYDGGGVFRIGTVGRLVAAKDYAALINAFKKLIEEGLNTELIFVGDGPERSRLESMVKDLEIAQYVRFLGFQADVKSSLSKFDIFALSSLTEGIPIAMLEAMAMGVPVVATRVGGIPEVIEDNVDGLLVEARNPLALADALMKLIKDNSFRKRIGETSRTKVARLFSCKVICEQYEKLYSDLLSRA